MPAKKQQPFNFEAALLELNQLVEKMEQGGLSLEASLALFERGIVLTRQCQQALQEAQQKVQILMETASGPALENYATKSSEEDE